MYGLEGVLAGEVASGVYRWPIEEEELFRTSRKPRQSGLTRTSEGRLALPLAMGGGHDDVEMPAWLREAEDAGWEVYGLGPAGTKNDFLAAAAEVFEFPDYFGGNWDAFFDCLTDLEWQPTGQGHLVVWAGWADTDKETFETALEIFGEAADSWADTETPFVVLLPGAAPEELPVLP
jgi:RNAse (barnase) inhibitor barstar